MFSVRNCILGFCFEKVIVVIDSFGLDFKVGEDMLS